MSRSMRTVCEQPVSSAVARGPRDRQAFRTASRSLEVRPPGRPLLQDQARLEPVTACERSLGAGWAGRTPGPTPSLTSPRFRPCRVQGCPESLSGGRSTSKTPPRSAPATRSAPLPGRGHSGHSPRRPSSRGPEPGSLVLFTTPGGPVTSPARAPVAPATTNTATEAATTISNPAGGTEFVQQDRLELLEHAGAGPTHPAAANRWWPSHSRVPWPAAGSTGSRCEP
jgi:hypothetical protein